MDTPAYAQCDATVARGLVNSLTSTPRGNDVRCCCSPAAFTALTNHHSLFVLPTHQSFYDPVSIEYYTGTVGN